jgi:hypothetical protein
MISQTPEQVATAICFENLAETKLRREEFKQNFKRERSILTLCMDLQTMSAIDRIYTNSSTPFVGIWRQKVIGSNLRRSASSGEFVLRQFPYRLRIIHTFRERFTTKLLTTTIYHHFDNGSQVPPNSYEEQFKFGLNLVPNAFRY